MPDCPNDNIFAKSPRTDKLICSMIVVKGGKAVMCATEFAEAHSGNFFKHIRELHKVTHNRRGTEFFALFKQTSALILGMPLNKDEMAKLNDFYYEQGIGAVMDTLKERLPMPDYVGSPTSHTNVQQADLVRVAVRIFKDKQWGKKTLLPAIHGILAQFEPKLENVRPEALAQHFKNASTIWILLAALRSARQPRQLFRTGLQCEEDQIRAQEIVLTQASWVHSVNSRVQASEPALR